VPAKLTGALYTYPTHGLYIGALIATARHGHHAGQIVWAPEGIDVAGEDGCVRRVVTNVVPPHALHSHGPTAVAAMLWIDRDDLRWDRVSHGASFAPPDIRLSRDEPVDADTARALADALLAVVAPAPGLSACVPRHPAVKRMCTLLDDNVVTPERSIERLAQLSGLSARQLRHCFTQELGINPSAYRRWRRLRQAFSAVERGATLTEAALAGGFADSAHFSRVFQAQFGMAPSQAFSSVRFVSFASGPRRAAQRAESVVRR
jgi:AraC-like DNA-binding protein